MTIGNTRIAAIRRTEETIVAPPATSSHVEGTPEERARLRIPEGLIRMVVPHLGQQIGSAA